MIYAVLRSDYEIHRPVRYNLFFPLFSFFFHLIYLCSFLSLYLAIFLSLSLVLKNQPFSLERTFEIYLKRFILIFLAGSKIL